MVEGKLLSHEDSSSLPIPTYDEATSRPSSSQSILSPEHNLAEERQGLLSRTTGSGESRQPTEESVRSSLDFENAYPASVSGSASTESRRREVEDMDFIDQPIRGSSLLSKHISSLTHSLSTLQLPRVPSWFPSLRQIREHAPAFKPNYIVLGRVFALILVLSLVYLFFLSSVFRIGHTGRGRNWIEPEALRTYFIDHIDETKIRDHLNYFTSL